MRLAFRIFLGILMVLLIIVGGLVDALNTGPGRNFAVREINKLAGPDVKIAGLGGRFPQNLTLQSVWLTDKNGVWLTADDVHLRWHPLALFSGRLHVAVLSATDIDMLRAPVSNGKPSKGGGGIPNLRYAVDHLDIGALHLPASLAGQAAVLHVQGAAQLDGLAKASATLNATTLDGAAQYHLSATLGHKNMNVQLHVQEPPGGLLGHVSKQNAPLTAALSLEGPRTDAALNFAVTLGAANLSGTGSVGTLPSRLFIDTTLHTPDLAPFGAIAGIAVGGTTQLHLRVAQEAHGVLTLALDGDAAVRNAEPRLQKLLGADITIAVLASLHDREVTIQKLQLHGGGFGVDVSGKAGENDIELATHAEIDQVGALSPQISGTAAETGTISGTLKDFAVQAKLSGAIGAKGQASDPFTVDASIQHLPYTPSGTLVANGTLEKAPLALNAAFARKANGSMTINIGKAQWRTLAAKADLQLAAGEMIPTGTATVAIKNLQDFSPFVPVHLHGALNGNFAYEDGKTVKLDVTAHELVVAPSLGAINGSITAAGPLQALGVKARVDVASVQGAPATLDFTGVLNLPNRSAQLSRLNASWRTLDANLQGPASIETKPAIAVHHLALALDGGTIALDGQLSPRLNAKAAILNLPVSLADNFVPALRGAGTINLDATVTGTPAAPHGTVTLKATGLHTGLGEADGLPPADIAGTAQLAGKAATLALSLNAGPDIAFKVNGLAPLAMGGAMNLHTQGKVDLRLLNLILAAEGTSVRGEIRVDLQLNGTPKRPVAAGTVKLSDGSVANIGTGLNLTDIGATIEAQGQQVILKNLTATAGHGTLTGQGTVGLVGDMPIALTMKADNASPLTSDLLSETLNGTVTVKGALRGPMALGGNIEIAKANINIPHGLPPSVANLPIINDGEKPPPPPKPAPPIALDIGVSAKNQIFIRGDGLFAELGGHIHLSGTLNAPVPQGKFHLIRGSFNLAGKSLHFTEGDIGFAGGFMPTLHLVATATAANANDATLTISGTAAKPVITLSSSPPLPSDEILAQLLFGQSASSLTPFQAASLAAALAQISGIGGGGINPLDKVRNALGLDELSVGGSGSGPPTLQAGRYVAPGVYVGATQAANGQGTQVNVQVDLYKGLKLQTATGTSSTGGDTNSVGLTYQFNY